MIIFDKEIEARTHYCSFFGKPGDKVDEEYVSLYLQTKFCNARCEFCDYHSCGNEWNHEKYEEILLHLIERVKIRKIGVTGGEPTLNWDNFVNISELSKKISPDSELSLNTNGFNWEKFANHKIFGEYDYINLSRHHYDDTINNEIFKTDSLPTTENLKYLVGKQTHNHQLQLRCNLIGEYINNKEEIFKYLDWANDIGIRDVGIIELMPINDYSKENKISIDIKSLLGDNFFLTKKWERCGGGCECCNYIYTPEDFKNTMVVYQKNTFNPSIVKDTLVFDGEYLRFGFGGDIIY